MSLKWYSVPPPCNIKCSFFTTHHLLRRYNKQEKGNRGNEQNLYLVGNPDGNWTRTHGATVRYPWPLDHGAILRLPQRESNPHHHSTETVLPLNYTPYTGVTGVEPTFVSSWYFTLKLCGNISEDLGVPFHKLILDRYNTKLASYLALWSGWGDSNSYSLGYQPSALTNYATSR